MAAPLSMAAPPALEAASARSRAVGGDLSARWRARLDALTAPGAPAGERVAPRAVLASPDPRAGGGAPPAARSRIAQPPGAGEAARTALEGLERARVRLDAAVAAARAGRSFTAGELLALQSDAYRFAQTVDLAARAVESGAQAVRQAVQTPL